MTLEELAGRIAVGWSRTWGWWEWTLPDGQWERVDYGRGVEEIPL